MDDDNPKTISYNAARIKMSQGLKYKIANAEAGSTFPISILWLKYCAGYGFSKKMLIKELEDYEDAGAILIERNKGSILIK